LTAILTAYPMEIDEIRYYKITKRHSMNGVISSILVINDSI